MKTQTRAVRDWKITLVYLVSFFRSERQKDANSPKTRHFDNKISGHLNKGKILGLDDNQMKELIQSIVGLLNKKVLDKEVTAKEVLQELERRGEI